MRPRCGYTSIELILVLTLTGALLAMAAPRLGRWRDAAAVHAARDDLIGALAIARIEAVAHGGASVVLDPAAGTGWMVFEDGATGPALDFHARHGVTLDVGSPDPVRIRYDGLGIGRMASRRVTLRRGGARGGAVISAYGRVRRW